MDLAELDKDPDSVIPAVEGRPHLLVGFGRYRSCVLVPLAQHPFMVLCPEQHLRWVGSTMGRADVAWTGGIAVICLDDSKPLRGLAARAVARYVLGQLLLCLLGR
jgi:hypothetical protein